MANRYSLLRSFPASPGLDSAADIPLTNNVIGDQLYVAETNRLYIWNGSGWYNIALINTAPTITSGANASYSLALDGTPTVITLTATDPEGIPITWSYAITSGSLGSTATISQADNVFTITPSTNAADVGSFEVTFTASDGVNTATSTSTISLAFLSGLWDETVLSIGTSDTNGIANSAFIDRSTNALTVTPSGTPLQTAFHPYLDNWSVEFDGSDALQISASVANDFGTSTDFTIEYWVKFLVNTSSGNQYVYDFGNNGSRTQLYQNVLYLSFTSSESVNTAYSEVGKWVHIALCRSGSTGYGFVNGQLIGTVALSGTAGSSSSWRIGQWGGAGIGLNGYISNFRTIKGTALYTSNFTPSTENLTAVSGTSLLTCQSNRFIDNSTNAHAITVTGDPVVSALNPFGQESEYAAGQNKGSAYFDGNGDYLSNTVADLSLTAGSDWTVSFWYYTSSTSGTQMLVTGDQSTSGAFECFFSNGTLKVGGAGVAVYLTVPSGNLPLNAWTHIAIVRDTSNLATAYVNGISKVTATWSVNNPTTGFFVGSYPSLYPFTGYLSDIRWRIGQKDYTANFTPPTAPVGNTNASLYLPMDNAGIFDKTGNNRLTLFGNTATSTTQTKYTDTAMYFDGSGDYLTAGDIDLNTNDFTIETWLYQVASGQYSSIFSTTINTGTANGLRISTGPSNNTFQVASAGSALINASTSFSNNVWNHVALTRSGSTMRLFLNGVQVGSVSNSTNFASDNWIIGDVQGAGAPYNFTGYMENFQILKGVAKYTGNFTPPTATQGITYQAET